MPVNFDVMTTSILQGAETYSASGSRNGILVLHGFTSDPRSMRPLADSLANRGYAIEMPRLPGHGTSVADMTNTGWSDWAAAAQEALDSLMDRCNTVGIAGLSMGGALSAWLAEHTENLAGVVLINPIVKPFQADMVDGLSQLIESGVETISSIGSDIKKEGVAESSYDAVPLSSLMTMIEGLKGVQADLGRITAPVMLFSSRDDHVVSSDNGDEVVAKVAGSVTRIWLENSFHVATLDNDAALLEGSAGDFFDSCFSS